MSALLWYNGNDNGLSTDSDVKDDEEKSLNDHQQKTPIKAEHNENTNNNNDVKPCSLEKEDKHPETNERKENENMENDDKPPATGNEVHVEVLHHGK